MDLTKLNQEITDLTSQVAATESVEDSAEQVLATFADAIKKAVADALAADAAANQTSIDAASAAIDAVTQRFTASAGKLGTAIANVPSTPPAPPPVTP